MRAGHRRRPTRREGRGASLRLLIPVAVVVGLITGIVGIGGGFLIVPALVLLGGIAMKQAVGTSLLVIAMNCASGFAGYLGRVTIPWTFVAAFTAVAVIGILAGTALARHVPQRALKQAFAVFLIVMGTFILVQNRRVFMPRAAAASGPDSLDRDEGLQAQNCREEAPHRRQCVALDGERRDQ